MKIFKSVIRGVSETIRNVCFGYGIARVFAGDYKAASLALLVVSILFIVGSFAEMWNK